MKKESFTRKEIIKFLDWLRDRSHYTNQGMNGWAKYGHSAYCGFTSNDVLEDYDEFLTAPSGHKQQKP